MKRNNLQAYAFLSPFLIFVTVLYAIPGVLTLAMAFTNLNSSFIWEFNGLKNFARMLKDPNTLVIAGTTLKYVVISLVIIITLDLLIAVTVTFFIGNQRVGEMFKAILMLPMITPGVVYSVLWVWLLDASESGLVNSVMISLRGGGAKNWIAMYPFQMVILATVASSLAYGTIVLSSAIKSIPETQIKAARVDGASEMSIVFSIIIPGIRHHISFLTFWEMLGLLTNYVVILLITDGGPGIRSEVWSLYAYHKAFVDQQYGYGAAISLVLIIAVVALMVLITRAMKKQKKEGVI